MNVVTIIGRPTSDIDIKMTTSGKSVCSFTLAVNKNYKRDEANFIPCIFWGERAEALAKYVKKGQQIAVTGELTSRQYEVDGKKRTAIEVVGERFDFCGSKSDGATNSTPVSESAFNGASTANYEEVGEEDLPF